MLSLLRKLAVAPIVVSLFGILAGNSRADNIKDVYDFDANVGAALNAGALYGQDGWVKAGAGTGSLIVASGADGWSGKYVTQPATGASDTQDYRINNGNWSFSIDTAKTFEVSCLVQVGGNGSSKYYYSHAGVQHYDSAATAGNNSCLAGVHGSQGLWWAVGATQYSKAATGLYTVSDDKMFRVGMYVSPTGVSGQYSVQRFYQDITGEGDLVYEGEPIVITDSGIPNDYANWNLPDWNAIQARIAFTSTVAGGRLDDIVVRAVPEPSTLILFSAGLLGLLAYAWRKRK